jgi:hypothetical protein
LLWKIREWPHHQHQQQQQQEEEEQQQQHSGGGGSSSSSNVMVCCRPVLHVAANRFEQCAANHCMPCLL